MYNVSIERMPWNICLCVHLNKNLGLKSMFILSHFSLSVMLSVGENVCPYLKCGKDYNHTIECCQGKYNGCCLKERYWILERTAQSCKVFASIYNNYLPTYFKTLCQTVLFKLVIVSLYFAFVVILHVLI